jgi:hypothetical protein
MQLHGKVLFRQCSCYSATRGVIAPPLIEILPRDLKGVVVLTETMNSHTFPHYGENEESPPFPKVLLLQCGCSIVS